MCTGAEIPAVVELLASAEAGAGAGAAASGTMAGFGSAGLGAAGLAGADAMTAGGGWGFNPFATQAGAPVSDLSYPYSGSGLASNWASGSAGGKGSGLLAAQMGQKLMEPPQRPPMQQAPPMQGGPQEPLVPPNGQPYGTPAGNSLGMNMPPSPDEMLKRKLAELRARGLLA